MPVAATMASVLTVSLEADRLRPVPYRGIIPGIPVHRASAIPPSGPSSCFHFIPRAPQGSRGICASVPPALRRADGAENILGVQSCAGRRSAASRGFTCILVRERKTNPERARIPAFPAGLIASRPQCSPETRRLRLSYGFPAHRTLALAFQGQACLAAWLSRVPGVRARAGTHASSVIFFSYDTAPDSLAAYIAWHTRNMRSSTS